MIWTAEVSVKFILWDGGGEDKIIDDKVMKSLRWASSVSVDQGVFHCPTQWFDFRIGVRYIAGWNSPEGLYS